MKKNTDPHGVNAAWGDFWDAFRLLHNLGLVFFIRHLLESDLPDAEIMYRCDRLGLPGEAAIAEAASSAAGELVPDHLANDTDGLVPVLAHMPKVTMIGIARLKYRARTRNELTWASREEKWQKISDQFRTIRDDDAAFAAGQNAIKKTA